MCYVLSSIIPLLKGPFSVNDIDALSREAQLTDVMMRLRLEIPRMVKYPKEYSSVV